MGRGFEIIEDGGAPRLLRLARREGAKQGGRVWVGADGGDVDVKRGRAEGLLRREERGAATADGLDDDGIQGSFGESISEARRRGGCCWALARVRDHQPRHRTFVYAICRRSA